MAETDPLWPVNLKQSDKNQVTLLARRRQALGLTASYAETLRAAVHLAMSASDDDLKRGEL